MNVNKNQLFYWKESIYRILEVASVATVAKDAINILEHSEQKILVIDCSKKTMPKWMPLSEIEEAKDCTEEELCQTYEVRAEEDLGMQEKKIAQERYHLISGILPFLKDDKIRIQITKGIAEVKHISVKTLNNYLCTYLAYQSVGALAPKETKEKSLTKDQKNIRWALNKFYYTRHRNTLADAYVMMLKEKYTDESGNLLSEYPSVHQFRYYYRQNKSLQREYISRDGIKNYEMNNRPLLGDGVQEFAKTVGTGMLDATICDIYLCDEAGSLVGRPVLVACVDAYSGLVCGYSLLWEGGMYSIRELLLNCITDKTEWCKKFGILIQSEEWNCKELPRILITDMGSEFKSYNMEQITELGCSVVNLPSFRAELKGPVEQIFNCAQNLFKPYLRGKGVIEPDFQKRGVRDYRKDACLTMEQFEQIILRCILYYNTKRVVENFPYTEEMIAMQVAPHACDLWNYGRKQTEANLIQTTEVELVRTLLPRTEARFTRTGLKANKLRYKADGYTEEYLQGGTVIVAYNPEDVSAVYLIRDGYKKFDLIESRFTGKPLEQALDMKVRQRELVKHCMEENLQAKVELAQHIEVIASQSHYHKDVKMDAIRDTRQRQKDLRHRNLVQEFTKEVAVND